MFSSLWSLRLYLVILVLPAILLSGCRRDNQLVISSGVGVTASREVCPQVATPLYTGTVTIFSPANQRTAEAIDVVATISKIARRCRAENGKLYSEAQFEVIATRNGDITSPREVSLPYFSSLVRGDDVIINKDVSSVTLSFAAGETSAAAIAGAVSSVNQRNLQLPPDILAKITRKRRAGNIDATTDPLSQPEVKEALARASHELLIGFQLTPEQFEYNARR